MDQGHFGLAPVETSTNGSLYQVIEFKVSLHDLSIIVHVSNVFLRQICPIILDGNTELANKKV